jgi:hypothetical protein
MSSAVPTSETVPWKTFRAAALAASAVILGVVAMVIGAACMTLALAKAPPGALWTTKSPPRTGRP